MTVRLEIGWRPELADAEGEGVRRRAREYFGLEMKSVRVLRVLMLDLEMSPEELEAVRTGIFTHPVTQVSDYAPLALDFNWAIWVGFKPGVRDTAGAVAKEAIEAFLGRPLPPEAAVYTSKIYLFSGSRLTGAKMSQVARELLANDMIQEFRVFSNKDGTRPRGWGSSCPGCS